MSSSSGRSQDSARIDHIVGLITKSQSNFNESMLRFDSNLEKITTALSELISKISETNRKLDELKDICKPREYILMPKSDDNSNQ
jgi:hypothetical protein